MDTRAAFATLSVAPGDTGCACSSIEPVETASRSATSPLRERGEYQARLMTRQDRTHHSNESQLRVGGNEVFFCQLRIVRIPCFPDSRKPEDRAIIKPVRALIAQICYPNLVPNHIKPA